MVMKHYPPEFKADAVALYRSRPGATIKQVAADLGSTQRRCGTGHGPLTAGARVPTRPGPWPRPTSRTRWRPSSRPHGRGSVSWRRSGASCAGRRSISPGGRTGEPLPVRRRPPAPLRRQAVVPGPRDRPLQLLLLAQDRGPQGGPAGC